MELIKQDPSNQEKLVLLALGPTATVLAYDLAILGYQAVDIGHIDIEYEWYQKKAFEKIPIEGKFVNESATNCLDFQIEDPTYEKSIIGRIG